MSIGKTNFHQKLQLPSKNPKPIGTKRTNKKQNHRKQRVFFTSYSRTAHKLLGITCNGSSQVGGNLWTLVLCWWADKIFKYIAQNAARAESKFEIEVRNTIKIEHMRSWMQDARTRRTVRVLFNVAIAYELLFFTTVGRIMRPNLKHPYTPVEINMRLTNHSSIGRPSYKIISPWESK